MSKIGKVCTSCGRLTDNYVAFKCPECGAWTDVVETRTSAKFGYTRRRECANEHRFTTREEVIPDTELREERREHFKKNLDRLGDGRRAHIEKQNRELRARNTKIKSLRKEGFGVAALSSKFKLTRASIYRILLAP